MKRVTDRKDVVVYNGSGNLKIEVLADANTVWLNRRQLALMFGRDVKTIGKHIANALKEELKGVPTVAKIATVQQEGKRTITRQVEYYDIDMILSVGYRVKSSEDIRFRMWANGVLKSRRFWTASRRRRSCHGRTCASNGGFCRLSNLSRHGRAKGGKRLAGKRGRGLL